MNDDMQQWLPVAEQIKNLSLNGLLIFRTILDTEIAMRQASFYNGDEQQNAENSLTCSGNGDYNACTKEKKVKLEVVK